MEDFCRFKSCSAIEHVIQGAKRMRFRHVALVLSHVLLPRNHFFLLEALCSFTVTWHQFQLPAQTRDHQQVARISPRLPGIKELTALHCLSLSAYFTALITSSMCHFFSFQCLAVTLCMILSKLVRGWQHNIVF